MLKSLSYWMLTVAITTCLAATPAIADQIVDAVDGQTVPVRVSSTSLNRISLQGGRITKVIGANNGLLAIRPDADTGQIYFSYQQGVVAKIASVFVTTDAGSTYTISLNPVNGAGESIVLRPRSARGKNIIAGTGANRSLQHDREIKRMMYAMATMNDEALQSCDVSEMNDEVALWKNAEFTLVQQVRCPSVIGEKYILKNKDSSQNTLGVIEQEFYRSGVMAVAVEHHQLAVGASTSVYIVSKNNE
ncbi:MAG: type-F conjugative transfer system secretin TraK [Mariprofundales bacterium]